MYTYYLKLTNLLSYLTNTYETFKNYKFTYTHSTSSFSASS